MKTHVQSVSRILALKYSEKQKKKTFNYIQKFKNFRNQSNLSGMCLHVAIRIVKIVQIKLMKDANITYVPCVEKKMMRNTS